MGRPFCFRGSANINVLPTLIIQWNPSNADTVGTRLECPDLRGILISGVVIYIYTQDIRSGPHSVRTMVDVRISGVSARYRVPL